MSSTTTELAALRRTLAQLRTSVDALRSRYGDLVAIQRLSNDVERLDIDLVDLSHAVPAQRRGADVAAEETVLIPDTPYDPSLWRDADDEGVGGQQRHTG